MCMSTIISPALTFSLEIIQLEFSLTWSYGSRPSSEWKLFRFDKMEVNYQLSNLVDW